MIPGEYFLKDADIQANVDRKTCTITAVNTGDRPIQVGSHFHFFEVNRAMAFDRKAAFGMRLNVPSGFAVRFEPGEEKEIELVAFGGARRILGINNLVDGDTTGEENKEKAVLRAKKNHFMFRQP